MPDRLVVSNTSPLLYLHQIGRLELLRSLYGQVTVPAAVADELGRGGELGIDVPALDRFDWLRVEVPPERLLLPAVVDLGPGEAEVIAFGLAHPAALLILDDRLARRVATALDLRLTGTIGVLVRAKKSGLLPSVRPSLEALRATTMRLGDELVRWAVAEAGETA